MNMVIAARESFMELPSAIRKRFDHDAGKFLEFVTNPDNADDLVEMGLARAPEPPPDPVKVEVINSDSSE